MKLGNFKYRLIIKVEKKPIIEKLKKDLKGLLDNFFKGQKIEFEIEGSNFLCEDLRIFIIAENEESKKFEMYLEKIGKNYGISYLSFPYWYYPK